MNGRMRWKDMMKPDSGGFVTMSVDSRLRRSIEILGEILKDRITGQAVFLLNDGCPFKARVERTVQLGEKIVLDKGFEK